jgi:hypothetical protein
VVLFWAFMIASVVRAEDSTKICYNALFNNDVDKDAKIDAEEYVGVVHEMSNGFFNRNAPFDDIPSSLRQNFQTLACLCQIAGNSDLPANECCNAANAHLQVSGTAPRGRPTFQQKLYLTNVCEETYAAIALALIASSGPTVSPSALEITRFPTPSDAGPLEGCAVGLGTPFIADDEGTKGIGAFGIIFHLRTITARPITVKSLRFLTSLQDQEISYKIYTRTGLAQAVIFGTAIQPVQDLSDWDEVADSNVTGRGLNLLTETNSFETPVYVPGNGNIQTFYLTLKTEDLRYLIGASSPPKASDQYMDVLTSGTGVKTYPGTSNLADYSDGRSFIGEVVYSIPSLPCDSSSPTSAPSQSDVSLPPSVMIPETASPVTKTPTLSPSISTSPTPPPNNFFNGPASLNFTFSVSLNTTEGATVESMRNELKQAMDLLVNEINNRRNLRRLRELLVTFNGTTVIEETKIDCPANTAATDVDCYSIEATVPLVLTNEEDKDASLGSVKSFVDNQITNGGLQTKVKEVNPNTSMFVIDSDGGAQPTPSPQSNSNTARTAGLAAGGALLLLGLAGGGYFFWRRRQQAAVQDDSRQDLYGKDNYNDSSYDVDEKPNKADNNFDDSYGKRSTRDDFDDDEYDSQSDYDSESDYS